MKNSTILSGLLVPPPVYYLVAIVIAMITRFFLHVSLTSHQALPVTGIIFIVVSVILGLWSKYSMSRNKTTSNSYEQSTKIVTGGPFCFSRNPMYLSITMLEVGLAFSFNDLILLVLTGVAFNVTNVVIRKEERYLTNKFGREYLDYKQKVRRWI